MSRSPAPRQPLGSLDGPSRTIRVEPVETPVPVLPPREPKPAREPDRPIPKPERTPNS